MARLPRVSRSDAVTLLGTSASTRADELFPEPTRKRAYRPPVVPTVPADARVLGLDLALGTTGYAVVEAGACLGFGTIVLPDRLHVREAPFGLDARRLAVLAARLAEVVAAWQPTHLAFEFPERIGRDWWNDKRGPLTPYYLGLARGLLVGAVAPLLAAEQVLPVAMGAAKRVIAGSPSAPKARVRLSIAADYGWDMSAMSDDVTDAGAIALAVFGGRRGGE
jgi:Holliday junction resolvasome RuvABC endonuclease subunit